MVCKIIAMAAMLMVKTKKANKKSFLLNPTNMVAMVQPWRIVNFYFCTQKLFERYSTVPSFDSHSLIFIFD